MNKHLYLRAYMAGIVVPTMFLLIGLTVFIIARFIYDVPVAIERLLVFPLAIVPNAWGVWNMFYVRLGPGRRLPLGLHGAALVFLLGPVGLTLASKLNIWIVTPNPTLVLAALPVVLIVYYLIWKHAVNFLSRLIAVE
jgi:hypothetical protein